MLAADWALIWTAIGSVTGVLGLIWLVVHSLLQGRSAREDRTKNNLAADTRAQRQAAAAADAALVGKQWSFNYALRAAIGDATPKRAPVEIGIVGANVWVHEVRLTWRPSQPALAPWVTKDAPCPPWPDHELPYHLSAGGRALELGWPGPNPTDQVQLLCKVEVTYSALSDGPRLERSADGGSIGWQES